MTGLESLLLADPRFRRYGGPAHELLPLRKALAGEDLYQNERLSRFIALKAFPEVVYSTLREIYKVISEETGVPEWFIHWADQIRSYDPGAMMITVKEQALDIASAPGWDELARALKIAQLEKVKPHLGDNSRAGVQMLQDILMTGNRLEIDQESEYAVELVSLEETGLSVIGPLIGMLGAACEYDRIPPWDRSLAEREFFMDRNGWSESDYALHELGLLRRCQENILPQVSVP